MKRFEDRYSTYTNAFTILSGKAKSFYRKASKDLSETLAEAVFELWKERTEAIKRLVEQTQTDEREHCRIPTQYFFGLILLSDLH